MRKALVLIGALLLAGCGGDGEDFVVDVAMAPDQAAARLATLDGGMSLRALSLPTVTADKSVRNELAFVLPGDDESGRLHLRFEEYGTNGTRIHVALSLPTNVQKIQGEMMMLSEAKAEELLQRRMTAWAEGVISGTASLDSLNEVLGGLTISLWPGKLNEVLAAANDPTKLAGLLDAEVMAEMEGADASEYDADAGDFSEPMLDPEADIADASQPMDDAQGMDPAGDDLEVESY
jgi:hypothetical protein